MNVILPHILFYIFAGLALLASVTLVFQRNPVKSALLLVLTFICTSVLWLLVQAEFLALILIIVYVGAVMTLFLFVIMMLSIEVEMKKPRFWRSLIMTILVLGGLLASAMHAFPSAWFKIMHFTVSSIHLTNTEQLGSVLYTDYVLAFETAAVILLVAMVSAVTLVHRSRRGAKYQNIGQQLKVRKQDRLSLKNF